MTSHLRRIATCGALALTSLGIGAGTLAPIASATPAQMTSTASAPHMTAAASAANLPSPAWCAQGNRLCDSNIGVFSVASSPSRAGAPYSQAVANYQASVKKIQTKLGHCAVDGVFGSYTAERVKAWQGVHGLAQDGVVGPATARSMGFTIFTGE